MLERVSSADKHYGAVVTNLYRLSGRVAVEENCGVDPRVGAFSVCPVRSVISQRLSPLLSKEYLRKVAETGLRLPASRPPKHSERR